MNAERRHIAEIRRLVDSIERTKSHKLTTDYGKRLTRMAKELAEYRMHREKHESTK